jgi:hypothetical protein
MGSYRGLKLEFDPESVLDAISPFVSTRIISFFLSVRILSSSLAQTEASPTKRKGKT